MGDYRSNKNEWCTKDFSLFLVFVVQFTSGLLVKDSHQNVCSTAYPVVFLCEGMLFSAYIRAVFFRLVHLDGSLADLSMIKPEFNPSEKDEEIGENVDLDEDEDDIKIRQEEDEEICSVYCKTASFSCHILSEPEPDQADGNFYTSY